MSAVRGGTTLSGSLHSKRIGHTINTVKSSRLKRELECPKSITWLGDWEPENKYVKPIVLKNTTLRLLKVKFTSPLTRTFSTPHPSRVIELAPGATRELTITFRPAEPIPYQDQITLSTNDGDYVVALRAKIATPKFRLPESVLFEPCAIGDVKTATFAVQNISTLETRYQWQTHPEQGFTINPSEGILQAQAQADFVMEFKPNQIASYRGIAQCRYGPDLEYTRRVSLFAESHFPQISLDSGNRTELDFGFVPGNGSKTKTVKLYNRTSVRARYIIERQEQIDEELHEFTIKQAGDRLEIGPNSSFELSITYKPYLVDDVPSRETFHIVDEFQPKIRHVTVTCVGQSPVPKVELSEDTIDFGMVDITGGRKPSVAHSLRIRNTGNVMSRFQFIVDCDCSVWQVLPKHGDLKPGAYTDIIVKFEPWSEAPYYRRLPLFVEGSGEPIMLALSGCAYSSDLKPVHLTLAQLSRSVTPRVERLDPESRQIAFDEGAILCENNELRFKDEVTTTNDRSEYQNFFDDDIKSVPNISLSTSSLVFENCTGSGQVHAQPVQVTNHTSGDIIAKWAIPVNKPYFTVHPQQVTLAPGASYLFTVRFSLEGTMESLFGGELELNCFYNVMMDYTELKTDFITPGWSKTLQVTASTFANKSEPFPVRVKTPNLVAAPPTPTGVPTYRAIMINAAEADLPSTYRTLNEAYQVYPQVGLINPADSFHLVLLRAISHPNEDVSELNFHFNNDPRHDQKVKVRILGGRPRLECQPECYLQPTMIGGSMKKTFVVTNTSNLLINYEWYNSNQANLIIEPKSGTINPLEDAIFEVELCPDEQKKYLLKPKLNYWTTNQASTEQLTVRCIGEGTVAHVTSSSSFVDFGSVMVNREKQEKLTLVNKSNCAVVTRLRVVESQDSQINDGHSSNSCKQLRVENCKREPLDCVTLGPRCSQTVYLSVQCSIDGNYSWEIYHEIVDQSKRKEKRNRYKEELICHVTAEICYPTLKMTHLSCSDIIPKQLLYELTQAKKLNSLLNAPPPPCGQEEDDELVIMNLNSSPHHSRPFQIRLEIVNPGNTAAHFKFLFPADFRIELEGWARHADLSHDQFEVLKIEEHKLFQIEPRQGVLKRGERKVIKMTYQHKLIGSHALPVVMSITGGRQIPLRLMGMTLSEADKCLSFPSEHYELKPVHLGLLRAPTQQVSFYNGSSQKIHYEIDLESIRALNESNWDWQILTVLNPKGVIEPNSCGQIQMAFLPLEARDYNVNLIIRISGGPDQVIRIRGRGVDPSRAESPADEAFLENKTKVEISEQQYALSQDRVKLGPVPLGSPVRRIIFLENRSSTNAALFQWKLYDERFMSIRPQSGQVEPGGQQMIRIEYFVPVDSEPAFHNIESCCEIISIDKVRHYLNNLANWEKEYKRQEEEFTIDDSIHQPKQVRLIESAGELRSCSPYSKLPPLSPLKSSKRQEPIWIKPRQPQPEQLQLTISARSLTRSEFLEKFPTEFDQFYTNSSEDNDNPSTLSSVERVECTDEESRTMKTIVANVVRTLLDDNYMHDILKNQMKEEPCYFAQLGGANWPPKRTEPNNRLIASIMAMEDSDCPPTPVNSAEDSSSNNQSGDPNQMTDLLLVEQIMSEMLENIVSQASSFETILTAKPLNIVQKQ